MELYTEVCFFVRKLVTTMRLLLLSSWKVLAVYVETTNLEKFRHVYDQGIYLFLILSLLFEIELVLYYALRAVLSFSSNSPILNFKFLKRETRVFLRWHDLSSNYLDGIILTIFHLQNFPNSHFPIILLLFLFPLTFPYAVSVDTYIVLFHCSYYIMLLFSYPNKRSILTFLHIKYSTLATWNFDYFTC